MWKATWNRKCSNDQSRGDHDLASSSSKTVQYGCSGDVIEVMSPVIHSTDVSSSALRAEVGRYLDRAEAGEVFRILRRGEPVAALLSVELFERLTLLSSESGSKEKEA